MAKEVQFSFDFKLERVAGIEPAYSAWKAAALPLSYTRAALSWHGSLRKAIRVGAIPVKASGPAVVEGVGFEPT
jgi:hypothetical protein